jgi:hypothetical protein
MVQLGMGHIAVKMPRLVEFKHAMRMQFVISKIKKSDACA